MSCECITIQTVNIDEVIQIGTVTEVVEIAVAGPQGPVGPQGPQGPAGSGGGIEAVQTFTGGNTIELNCSEYNVFVCRVDQPVTFTFANFPAGRSINVYLEALHQGNVLHTFPVETYFAELGTNNSVYSFEGYVTRLLLQNTGDRIFNFGEIISLGSYYYYGGDGIGTELLDEL
jgi:hypothetical protein